MKFVTCAVGLVLLLLFAAADPSYAARRVALVIGNTNYQGAPALSKSENDANAMIAKFRQAGFDIVIAQSNANLTQLKKAIADFKNEAANSDIAVAYFAGYGIDIEGVNYLVPVDAKLAIARDVAVQAVTLESMADAAGGAKRLPLVVIDALHGDPFPAGKAEQDPGLDEPSPQAGTLIAYPAMAGTEADDGASVTSIYTGALLQNLFAPGLDIRLAFGRVLDEVLRNSQRQQSSYVFGSLGGGNISLVAAPPDRPMMDLAGEKTDYRVIEQINTAHAWEVFMVQHPTGFYFSSAREKLRLAEREATAPASQPTQRPPRRPETATREEGSPAGSSAGAPDLGTPALISSAQQELARLGCYSGTTTGELDPATRDAIDRYEKAQGLSSSGPVGVTRDFLTELQKHKARVCPLTCLSGQTAQGERCVDAPTSASVAHHNEPQAPPKRPPAKPAQAPASPPRSSGQASSNPVHVQPGVGF